MKIRAVVSGSLLLQRQIRFFRSLRVGRVGVARSRLVDRLRLYQSRRMTRSEKTATPTIRVKPDCSSSCYDSYQTQVPTVEAPPPVDRVWPSDMEMTESEVRVERTVPARVSLDVGQIIDLWW